MYANIAVKDNQWEESIKKRAWNDQALKIYIKYKQVYLTAFLPEIPESQNPLT